MLGSSSITHMHPYTHKTQKKRRKKKGKKGGKKSCPNTNGATFRDEDDSQHQRTKEKGFMKPTPNFLDKDFVSFKFFPEM